MDAVNKKIINDLKSSAKLNFKGLFDLIEKHNVIINFVPFKIDAHGLTTFDCVYINNKFVWNEELMFFVISHEICHYLKVKRMGFDLLVKNYLNNTLENYLNLVINEEILADRYANYIGNILNKDNNNFISFSQELEKESNQLIYKNNIGKLFSYLPTDYDKYVEFIHENLVDVK